MGMEEDSDYGEDYIEEDESMGGSYAGGSSSQGDDEAMEGGSSEDEGDYGFYAEVITSSMKVGVGVCPWDG